MRQIMGNPWIHNYICQMADSRRGYLEERDRSIILPNCASAWLNTPVSLLHSRSGGQLQCAIQIAWIFFCYGNNFRFLPTSLQRREDLGFNTDNPISCIKNNSLHTPLSHKQPIYFNFINISLIFTIDVVYILNKHYLPLFPEVNALP